MYSLNPVSTITQPTGRGNQARGGWASAAAASSTRDHPHTARGMAPPPTGRGTSKFQTACAWEMQNSLKCMETGDKEKCADLIEMYKDCRKEESDKKKEARAASAGGGFKW